MSLEQVVEALLTDEEYLRRCSELRKVRHRAAEVELLVGAEPDKYTKRLRSLQVEAVFLQRELTALVARIQRRLLGGSN